MNRSPASLSKLPLNSLSPSLRWIACAVVAVAGLASANDVQAQGFGINGFQPFGFYQPYGIQYRSSVPTPPYFSVNPPVYYGTRHYRPYGISPFAAPPQVTAPASYEGSAAASGIRSRNYTGPVGNPFVCQSDSPGASSVHDETVSVDDGRSEQLVTTKAFTAGKVQTNPFVSTEVHFARVQESRNR